MQSKRFLCVFSARDDYCVEDMLDANSYLFLLKTIEVFSKNNKNISGFKCRVGSSDCGSNVPHTFLLY